MGRLLSMMLYYFGAFAACTIMIFNSGCVSGGFKLTREYARWVNSQNIILRIILYILTSVVFAVTMLIDVVVFNTVDFWEGRVSEGTYEFKDAKKMYHVKHEFIPGSGLKRSTIHVKTLENVAVQEVVLLETTDGQIQLYVDGKMRAQARDISTFPNTIVFDDRGNVIEEKTHWFMMPGSDSQKIVKH